MDIAHLVFRYMVTRRIALVAVLCFAVAVCAMIVVTSVMDGFQVRIRKHVRGTQADFTVRMSGKLPADHGARIEAELAGELAGPEATIAALSPRLTSVALLQSRGPGRSPDSRTDRYNGIEIVGIDWHRERAVVPLDEIVAAVEDPRRRLGTPMDVDPLLSAVPGLLVGEVLAEGQKLAVHPLGEQTSEAAIITGRFRREVGGESAVDAANQHFLVVGCFRSGRKDYDQSHAYMSREAFRTLRYGGDPTRPDATEVSGRLREGLDLETAVASLRARHPRLVFETWMDRNSKLLDAITIEKRVMALILFFIIAVAVSMMGGLLYLMVVEKTRDIGVLRSMGMGRRRLIGVFMVYGAALGIAGAAAGVGLGLVVVRNLGPITEWIADHFGFEIFSRRIYRMDKIPAVIDAAQVAAVAAAAFGLTVVGSAVAAAKAARLDPIASLRYE